MRLCHACLHQYLDLDLRSCTTPLHSRHQQPLVTHHQRLRPPPSPFLSHATTRRHPGYHHASLAASCLPSLQSPSRHQQPLVSTVSSLRRPHPPSPLFPLTLTTPSRLRLHLRLSLPPFPVSVQYLPFLVCRSLNSLGSWHLLPAFLISSSFTLFLSLSALPGQSRLLSVGMMR